MPPTKGMATDLIPAKDIKIGDTIEGPDGVSTVIEIRPPDEAGFLHIGFAEGRGNRCTVFQPEEKILRRQRAYYDFATACVVDKKGQVIIRNVIEVKDSGLDYIHIRTINTDVSLSTTISRSKISHIIGSFTLRF